MYIYIHIYIYVYYVYIFIYKNKNNKLGQVWPSSTWWSSAASQAMGLPCCWACPLRFCSRSCPSFWWGLALMILGLHSHEGYPQMVGFIRENPSINGWWLGVPLNITIENGPISSCFTHWDGDSPQISQGTVWFGLASMILVTSTKGIKRHGALILNIFGQFHPENHESWWIYVQAKPHETWMGIPVYLLAMNNLKHVLIGSDPDFLEDQFSPLRR